MGISAASLLIHEGQEVTIVDSSESELEVVKDQLDAKTVLGSGVAPRVLREADIQRADLVIATTTSDETNVITCFLAKELGAKKTIARVRNPEYTGYLISEAESPNQARRVVTPKSFGVDRFINPEVITAEEVVSIISGLYATEKYDFAGGLVQLRAFDIKNEALINRPIRELSLPRCIIVAITRPEGTIVPNDGDILKLDNRIYLMAANETMDELGTFFSGTQSPIESVIILGGEHIGFNVAQILEKTDCNVKIIEQNKSRCEEIAPKLHRATVIRGQGTDSDFLREEGISSTDAFIAATSNDELNILAGLQAKSLGVKRNLVMVNKPDYIPVAENLGIDVALSPLLLAAGTIVRYVSRGEVVKAALLAGEEAQAIEFIAEADTPIVGKELSKLKLPKGAKIGAIVHNNTVTIAQKDAIIQTGDHVIVVCLSSVRLAVDELFH